MVICPMGFLKALRKVGMHRSFYLLCSGLFLIVFFGSNTIACNKKDIPSKAKQAAIQSLLDSTPNETSPAQTVQSKFSVVVTTLAGSARVKGHTNGIGTTASFNYPRGIAVDKAGNLYIADYENQLIRKITPGGVVTTLAGGAGADYAFPGYSNGIGTSASFLWPTEVAVDTSGNVYVADSGHCLIRKITSGGVVSTLAGSGSEGSADGIGRAASFSKPEGVAVDTSGNVYVADSNVIRKITCRGVVTTLAKSSGVTGSTDRSGNLIIASLNYPSRVAVDTSGNVYFTDSINSRIRKITPDGIVTTLAGSAGVAGAADGMGTAALFNAPEGIAVDTSGNIYVADTGNELIRKITAEGMVTTLAGSGEWGSANGMGFAASFNNPEGVAVDPSGNVYVADSYNHLIRKITPSVSWNLTLLIWGFLLILFREIIHSKPLWISGILLILFLLVKKCFPSVYSKLVTKFKVYVSRFSLWITHTFKRIIPARPLASLNRQAANQTMGPSVFSKRENLLIGGHYEILQKIGEGGMGVVYKGIDRDLEKPVALKKIREELKLNNREKKRFLDEAKTVAKLHHPNIVDIYQIVEDGEETYLVFELVEGQTVESILENKGHLKVEEALGIFRQVCSALAFAHKNSIVHRDLKPSNVMLSHERFVKVMDFGIARQVKDTLSRVSGKESSGTLAYMAPEQEMGEANERCDIFALGVFLYEMLTGQIPFPGPNFLVQKERMKFKPLRELVPEVTEGLKVVVVKCLQADPFKRYQNVNDLLKALEQVV